MPMPPYPIYCQVSDCKNPAPYKIAARWSDGVVSELKTYSLCCEECVANSLRRGLESHQRCRQVPGETLDKPGIYLLKRGQRDQVLQRMTDLETQVMASPDSSH